MALLSWPCFHSINNANEKIQGPMGHFAIPNLCAMVSQIPAMHIRCLSSISIICLALHELIMTALCQIDQMKEPSFLLCVLSQTFPPFNVTLGRMMPCHLSYMADSVLATRFGSWLMCNYESFLMSSNEIEWGPCLVCLSCQCKHQYWVSKSLS